MMPRLALTVVLVLNGVAHAGDGSDAQVGTASRTPATTRTAFAVPGEATHTDTTVTVPRRVRLELRNSGGDIVVSAWNRNAVRVQADHGPRTQVGLDVGPAAVVVRAITRLRITDVPAPRRVRIERDDIPARVDYRLTVPRWMSLRLSGVNTQMLVENVEGDVSAEVVGGPVAIRGGRGSIRISAINGGVEVVGARGPVEASSVNRGIVLRDVEGPVRVESVNGDVDLARIDSDAVVASTVSGHLRYEGAIRAGGSYRFGSHSGDVTVVLPRRPDVAVSVEAYSGDFRSDFPVPVTRLKRGRQFDFILGDGRAELNVESFSGTIRLVHAEDGRGREPGAVRRRAVEIRKVKEGGD